MNTTGSESCSAHARHRARHEITTLTQNQRDNLCRTAHSHAEHDSPSSTPNTDGAPARTETLTASSSTHRNPRPHRTTHPRRRSTRTRPRRTPPSRNLQTRPPRRTRISCPESNTPSTRGSNSSSTPTHRPTGLPARPRGRTQGTGSTRPLARRRRVRRALPRRPQHHRPRTPTGRQPQAKRTISGDWTTCVSTSSPPGSTSRYLPSTSASTPASTFGDDVVQLEGASATVGNHIAPMAARLFAHPFAHPLLGGWATTAGQADAAPT